MSGKSKGPKKNFAGMKVGRLTVTSEAVPVAVTRTVWKWKCVCSCGKVSWVAGGQLTARKTLSCGCLVIESTKRTKTTHGRTNTREYRIWGNMLSRCRDKDDPRYGGRGIKVCERWHRFEAFLEDMGECPDPTSELDRIDNDGDYELGNCRWTDKKTNCRNRSSNRRLTYQGRTATVEEWAEHLNIPVRTLRSRIRIGWDDERALATPFRGAGR